MTDRAHHAADAAADAELDAASALTTLTDAQARIAEAGGVIAAEAARTLASATGSVTGRFNRRSQVVANAAGEGTARALDASGKLAANVIRAGGDFAREVAQTAAETAGSIRESSLRVEDEVDTATGDDPVAVVVDAAPPEAIIVLEDELQTDQDNDDPLDAV
jgi:hypothetical protein